MSIFTNSKCDDKIENGDLMEQSKIYRINELARKSKETGLTDDEKAEQEALRREYIDAYKNSLVCQLENMYIVDEQGNKRKVKRKD